MSFPFEASSWWQGKEVSSRCFSEQKVLTGKKLPMIHSKMVPNSNKTGPTKKNMPNTPLRPAAPPQPIMTIAKLNVEMTKPTKPIGVGLAYRLFASPT